MLNGRSEQRGCSGRWRLVMFGEGGGRRGVAGSCSCQAVIAHSDRGAIPGADPWES